MIFCPVNTSSRQEKSLVATDLEMYNVFMRHNSRSISRDDYCWNNQCQKFARIHEESFNINGFMSWSNWILLSPTSNGRRKELRQKRPLKVALTLNMYACAYWIALYFWRAYLLCYKQEQLFKNAKQCGKHMCK